MKKYYIIYSLKEQGYWAKEYDSFKGIIYATKYKSKIQAIKEVPDSFCTIITIYKPF